MEQQKKIKPFHVIIIVICFAASAALFIFKDKIIPNPNHDQRDRISTYVKTTSMIIDVRVDRPNTNRSRVYWVVEYQSAGGDTYTAQVQQDTFDPRQKGDSMPIYYNPENPREIIDEELYKDIVR